ncbi:hypothetical protein [Denitrobaculum tricleocarpae]|uniref:Uncharacterized protein n=1 Tax=Denitrobaculum tricleocarpae TaxID=2591009 RepID=A0A545U149_9PROT|nr:hypothetical protein [Denitrobaculum tricleocarpae]TQV83207.1 hypothetical protein FKG95_00990 [Denitrobaculum tricleocarpae]
MSNEAGAELKAAAKKAEFRSLTESFRRMSIWERGHFANSFRLNPVTEIDISTESLRLKRRYGEDRSYAWSDIEDSFFIKKRAHKAYGAGTGGTFTKRELHIVTRDETYKIDVSANFPDFKHTRKMLMALKKYLFIFDR